MLRYGLESPEVIRIRNHLDGFRMIRFALYIRESWEIDRRNMPPISEAIRGSGGKKLDSLLWQRFSNLSDVLFVAILTLLSVEPTTLVPSRVNSQWRERPSSYNGDHNSIEMSGAPPVGRRARTTLTTPSNYVRTTLPFGAHSSSRLWSLLLVAGYAPHRRQISSTCGRH